MDHKIKKRYFVFAGIVLLVILSILFYFIKYADIRKTSENKLDGESSLDSQTVADIQHVDEDISSEEIQVTENAADSSQTEEPDVESEPKWECVEIIGEREQFTTCAADLYDTFGFGWFECKESGYYIFYPEGNLYDKNAKTPEASPLSWEVYLLDEPLAEAPRFIPQSNEATRIPTPDKGTYIEESQYIVVYCSQNLTLHGPEQTGDPEARFVCRREQ